MSRKRRLRVIAAERDRKKAQILHDLEGATGDERAALFAEAEALGLTSSRAVEFEFDGDGQPSGMIDLAEGR